MKRSKAAKNVPTQNTKISDFFTKTTNNGNVDNKTCDNKRKHSDTIPPSENMILSSLMNFPSKSKFNISSTCKKVKHNDENHIPSEFHTNTFVKTEVQDIGSKAQKDEYSTGEYNSLDNKYSMKNNFQKKSPEKCSSSSHQLVRTPTPKKGSEASLSSGKKTTPQGSKRGTPKKLFEKSPRKLEEFNVQILKDFVQISPSTSNKIVKIKTTPNKPCVVLHGTSPSSLRRHTSVQKYETTPSKSPKHVSKNVSPTVRAQLKFSEDDGKYNVEQSQSTKEMAQNEEHAAEDFKEALDNMFNEEFNIIVEKFNNINFTEPQHCKILQIEKCAAKSLLKLKSNNGDVGFCSVEEFWSSSSKFQVGDTVTVNAVKTVDGNWVVNNKAGWLIYEPDLLISCTSVVGSLFCKRKSVLSERFRGFEPGNRVMLVGILIHTLLQNVLKQKLKIKDEIVTTLNNMLKSEATVKRLYECNLTFNDIEPELLSFVPKIMEFVNQYVYGNCSQNQAIQNWKGKICDIDDIEENIMCPELGIKGKIDVTIKTETDTMPLELKTGRATVSLEHRGQVMLYMMMMNRFGYKVSSGLLLYLREGVLKEVKATTQEQRDIIILRNELAYYLTKNTIKDNALGPTKLPELPEPINHHSACAKCSYNVICTSFLKFSNHDLSKNTALQEVQNNVTAHLTEAHLNYFIHWCTLLSMEAKSSSDSKQLFEIYTVEPSKRELQGKCIINVKVAFVGMEFNNLFEHKFEKVQCSKEINLLTSGIVENNYIVVSTDNRAGIAAGFVTNISSTTVTVLLDRNLNSKYQGKCFHLDTYDTNITQTFNTTSVALLLDDTPRAAHLRSIIIDKMAPSFSSKLPSVVAKRGAPILRRLNHVQQRAVLKALCAKDFFLIKGMPGTGKTATIVALVQLLTELNKTVLITSHTHSAVDNICLRLQKYGVKFMRLGSESRVDKNLSSQTEAMLTKGCGSPEQLQEIYNSFNVVAVTCLGSSHPLLSQRSFDFCIVDESTQVLQTSVIRPLSAAKIFILIGDPDQLAPVVQNRNAVKAGMTETLFERLSVNTDGIVSLNLSYRMNKVITSLANTFTYNGELQTANELVANKTLIIPDFENIKVLYKYHPWLLKALDASLEASVQFIDTGPVWQFSQNVGKILSSKILDNLDNDNCVNIYEIAIVVMLVNALTEGGVPCTDIGVIATYRAQVAQISTLLCSKNVDVSTVDQFQGRDKNVIIYSCSKSKNMSKTPSDTQKFELLEDKRRLTVAITRAKQKLLMVGDSSTLQNYNTFSTILTALQKQNIIHFGSNWTVLNDVI